MSLKITPDFCPLLNVLGQKHFKNATQELGREIWVFPYLNNQE